MISRRSVLAGGLTGGAVVAGLTNPGHIRALLAKAYTSDDSRWYPFDARLSARLADLSSRGWDRLSPAAINNRHLLDLRDLESLAQLRLKRRVRVLERSERWELSAERPELGNDVGYPSVVASKNEKGSDKFSLFYAIHDAHSGIGLAQASSLLGPYVKRGDSEALTDSRILVASTRPRKTSHFSSPVVMWNAETKLWHLYFHYYCNRFEEGYGHQNTGLATSTNLVDWSVIVGGDGGILGVLPTTRDRWMNSQSSYHCIQRLPNGLWLAFLRGTGGEMKDGAYVQDRSTSLGFAVSEDGIRWSLVTDAPQLISGRPPVSVSETIRPAFMAILRDGVHCCWSESDLADSKQVYRTAATTDFRKFIPSPSDFSRMSVEDGAVVPWRVGNQVTFFTGPYAFVFGIQP